MLASHILTNQRIERECPVQMPFLPHRKWLTGICWKVAMYTCAYTICKRHFTLLKYQFFFSDRFKLEWTQRHGACCMTGMMIAAALYVLTSTYHPLFKLEHGVCQGSVLSPSLFLLVMDPLLRQLQSLSVGLSVNNTYAGGYLHADDIRTLASSSSSLEALISTVIEFTSENFLKLNASKCKIVLFRKSSSRSLSLTSVVLDRDNFPTKESALDTYGTQTSLQQEWWRSAFRKLGELSFKLIVSLPSKVI